MSHQERASIVGLISGVLLNTYVVVRLWGLFADDALTGEDAPMLWARAIVWVIPAAIAISAGASLVFAMAARGDKRHSVVDERDHLFQYRGLGVLVTATAVGFMGMIISLALGVPVVIALTIMYGAVAIGDVVGNIVRIASYRIGG